VHPQFYEACLTLLAAAMMAASVVTRPGRTRTHGLILGMMVSMMAWSGGVAATHALSDPAGVTFAAKFAFVGGFGVPPLWLMLAANVTRLDAWFERPLHLAVLALPSALGVVALVTNHHHGLLIRDVTVITSPSTFWAGPLYWAWAVWGAVLVVAGIALYIAGSLRMTSARDRRRGILLGITALLPMLSTTFHNLGDSAGSYDRTVLCAGISIGLLFFFDWRYRLLSVMPGARRAVIEQLGDGVLIADLSLCIVDMNAAAEKMLDAPLTTLRGQGLARCLTERADGSAKVDEVQLQRRLASLIDPGAEFTLRGEDFAQRVYEVRGASVRGRDGRPEGLYLILRDITSSVRLEELMRQSQRLESLASLAAGITHEINNPLAYVRANVSLIQGSLTELAACASVDRPAKPVEEKEEAGLALAEIDELREVAEETLEGIDRISRIVERVRRFSHLGHGEVSRVALAAVVDDALRVTRMGRIEGLGVSVDLEPHLPELEASGEALTQALVNLIVNAGQAMGPDGGNVHVSARATGSEVEVRVADDGPGIPPDLRERIFDPFFTTKPAGKGTGLGLAVAVGIVREHGGSIELTSPEAGGAVFTLRLPVDRVGPA